ncbi:DUF4402 domain-containing protein [Phenylobacterium sp.]|uniref:DUF4402 domain-containing protein n=1 Tax=Phenylobacterium sp. TaxID=1871053 RepID=UPI003983A369
MSSNIRSLALALAAATLATTAHAQATSSQSTNVGGTIFQPIVLSKTADLQFGTIVRPATGSGVVTVSQSDGTRSLAGDGALLVGGPHTAPTRAAFSVSGEGGQAISINVPANLNMTRSGGSELIAVTLTASATSATLTGALGAPGSTTFGVGGSIPVAPTTASGAYSGSFQVTVSYN